MTKINTLISILLLVLCQACGDPGEGDTLTNTDLGAQTPKVAPVIKQQNAAGCPASQQETVNGMIQCKK